MVYSSSPRYTTMFFSVSHNFTCNIVFKFCNFSNNIVIHVLVIDIRICWIYAILLYVDVNIHISNNSWFWKRTHSYFFISYEITTVLLGTYRSLFAGSNIFQSSYSISLRIWWQPLILFWFSIWSRLYCYFFFEQEQGKHFWSPYFIVLKRRSLGEELWNHKDRKTKNIVLWRDPVPRIV